MQKLSENHPSHAYRLEFSTNERGKATMRAILFERELSVTENECCSVMDILEGEVDNPKSMRFIKGECADWKKHYGAVVYDSSAEPHHFVTVKNVWAEALKQAEARR